MPRLALVPVVTGFLSLFVLRTAIHGRRTGTAGVRGFSGPAGSLEWNAGALAAQISRGGSWRIGVDAAETTDLATGGLFAWVRDPIFSFILPTGVGLVALLPTSFSLFAQGLTAIGIEIHVRAVEGPSLAQTHGAAERECVCRVGRRLPGVGRMDADTESSGDVAG